MSSIVMEQPRRTPEIVALFLLALGVVTLIFFFVLAYAGGADGGQVWSDNPEYKIALALLGVTFTALIMNVIHPMRESQNWLVTSANFITLGAVLGLASYLASRFTAIQAEADLVDANINGAVITMIGISIGATALGSLIFLVQFVIELAHAPGIGNRVSKTAAVRAERKSSPRAKKSSPRAKRA